MSIVPGLQVPYSTERHRPLMTVRVAFRARGCPRPQDKNPAGADEGRQGLAVDGQRDGVPTPSLPRGPVLASAAPAPQSDRCQRGQRPIGVERPAIPVIAALVDSSTNSLSLPNGCGNRRRPRTLPRSAAAFHPASG